MKNPVKLIIFDSDGTVVSDFDRKKYATLIKSFLKIYGKFENAKLDKIIERQNMLWKRVEYKALVGRISQKKANEFWINKLNLDKNLAKKFIELDMKFWRKSVISKSTKEIGRTLRKLKSMGFILAVLSNDVRNSLAKKTILSWINLDKYFDKI